MQSIALCFCDAGPFSRLPGLPSLPTSADMLGIVEECRFSKLRDWGELASSGFDSISAVSAYEGVRLVNTLLTLILVDTRAL